MEPGSIFDPKTFVVSSPLNGKRAKIVDAMAIRHNYGGSISSEVTALRLQIDAGFDTDRVNFIACGGLFPSEDGKTRASAGPFLCGGAIEMRSNLADFLNALSASGFPMDKLRKQGFFALNDAWFVWKSFEKKVGKEMKVYDTPAEFLGYEDQEVVKEEQAAVGSPSTLTVDVQEAVLKALEKFKEIPRGQLSIRVGPMLKDHPQRAECLALLMNDDFLKAIPDVYLNKGVLSRTPF